MLAGIVVGVLVLGFLSVPERNSLVARGPMNTGHEALSCQECHVTAEGTLPQQVSSRVYHWLGLRKSAISFGSEDVTSKICLECHEREDDRHPISRFLEPRFSEARQNIKAYDCITCHTEHQGKRITLSTIGYCTNCHQDTSLEVDPITPTHVELGAQRVLEHLPPVPRLSREPQDGDSYEHPGRSNRAGDMGLLRRSSVAVLSGKVC